LNLNGHNLSIPSITGAGVVTLNGATLTVDFSGGSPDSFTGTIVDGTSAGGGLTKLGTGTLTLSGGGGDTYTGATTISAGTLQLGANSGVPVGAVIMNGGATATTFDLNSHNDTISSLTGDANSTISLGTGTLTVGDSTPNTVFAGAITGPGN